MSPKMPNWYGIEGSFPRVSGDEPNLSQTGNPASWCFPRVSGDEPWIGRLVGRALPFSPRERG